MLWSIVALAYLMFNILGSITFYKMLRPKLANPALAWLFGTSLSLSLSFPLALWAFGLYIKTILP